MLSEKMLKAGVNVWLINTGWTGGPYGVGSRMKLAYTRAMITAAMNGELDNVAYENHAVFNVAVPQEVPNVPSEVLNPRNTWSDKDLYDTKAKELAVTLDRKSTRLNSSHVAISYAVFCLKKKKHPARGAEEELQNSGQNHQSHTGSRVGMCCHISTQGRTRWLRQQATQTASPSQRKAPPG